MPENEQEINAVIEGIFNYDLRRNRRLRYEAMHLYIPRNAISLFIPGHKFHLYGLADSEFKFFRLIQRSLRIEGGWSLDNQCETFDWIFDIKRSLITKDGRIFIEEDFLGERERWYENTVVDLMVDSGDIFFGRRSVNEVNSNPKIIIY